MRVDAVLAKGKTIYSGTGFDESERSRARRRGRCCILGAADILEKRQGEVERGVAGKRRTVGEAVAASAERICFHKCNGSYYSKPLRCQRMMQC